MSLLNPVTGKHIVLPEHVKLDPHDVVKVAFEPNPSVHDYTVVRSLPPRRPRVHQHPGRPRLLVLR